MKKYKKCKGTGNAKGLGCGVELPFKLERGIRTYKAKYGLGFDCGCYPKFLYTSPLGKKMIAESITKGKAIVKKEKRKEFIEKKRNFNSKNAMNNADVYFSRYIRLKHSVNGKCTCYTCGTIKDIKEVDNGHYMKREHKGTRYHEDNCRPQCKICNGDTKHNGKQIEFKANLINEIGEENVLHIESLAKSTFKVNAKFFRDISDTYRLKVNELQKELRVKYW